MPATLPHRNLDIHELWLDGSRLEIGHGVLGIGRDDGDGVDGPNSWHMDLTLNARDWALVESDTLEIEAVTESGRHRGTAIVGKTDGTSLTLRGTGPLDPWPGS